MPGTESESERRRESIAVPPGVTVEQFLRQQCEELVAKVLARSSELSAAMRADFQSQKDRIRNAMEIRKAEFENTENGGDAENKNAQGGSRGANRSTQGRTTRQPSKTLGTSRGRNAGIPVSLLCTTNGDYKDHAFHLMVMPGKPCLVGRSRGVKFKRNGVSLPNDQEVSTTHGKIELSADGCSVTFEDAGSTNGTVLNNEPLAPNSAHVLSNGDELVIGNNSFVVTSLPEDSDSEE
jgi:hypothetical protein